MWWRQWTVNRANEKGWEESMDEQIGTEASSYLQCRPLNSDGESDFRPKRWVTERKRDRGNNWEGDDREDRGFICIGAPSKVTLPPALKGQLAYPTSTTNACSASAVCRHFNCSPLTSNNGFTVFGLVDTNTLYAHARKHTKYMKVAISLRQSTIKRDTLISATAAMNLHTVANYR